MTMPPHAERVRALAELTVVTEGAGDGGVLDFPDERFAALRGKHEWVTNHVERTTRCRLCSTLLAGEDYDRICLRDDADALLEAAAACGYDVEFSWDDDEGWLCDVTLSMVGAEARWSNPPYSAKTPAEALSAALYEAVIGGE